MAHALLEISDLSTQVGILGRELLDLMTRRDEADKDMLNTRLQIVQVGRRGHAAKRRSLNSVLGSIPGVELGVLVAGERMPTRCAVVQLPQPMFITYAWHLWLLNGVTEYKARVISQRIRIQWNGTPGPVFGKRFVRKLFEQIGALGERGCPAPLGSQFFKQPAGKGILFLGRQA